MQKRRAWGYVRCSHQKQVEEGDSLDVQKSRVEALCSLENYALAGIFCEPGISGSIPFCEREEGAKLLATVQKGDVVVGLKLDRCFRNSLDALQTLETLRAKGVGLYLADMRGDVTSDGVAKLVFSVLAATAEMERTRTAERITDAKRYQREQGRFLGGKHVPFGYRKEMRDDKPFLVPIEALHAQARDLKARGTSLRRAAAHFQAQGHQVSHCGVRSLYEAV